MKKSLLGAAALACATAAPANAAVNITVEGGGTPVVFEENGSRFALLGIDARDPGSIATTVDLAFVNSEILSGPQATNLFGCTGSLGTNDLNCTPNASVDVLPGQRLFDSLLAQFSGTGNVVFRNTNTLNLGVTRDGAPPISNAGAVPEPATWMLLLLGFFGIGGVMRSKGAARRSALRTA